MEVETGSSASKSPQTGKSYAPSFQDSCLLTEGLFLTHHTNSGHVWYSVPPDQMTKKHYYAWRLWKISLPVDAEGWLELCVRTWDSSNNTEPTFVRSAWK